jgi:hypothetical protein
MKRLILTLFVGLLCFTYQAKAQWTVIDPSNLVQNIKSAVQSSTTATNMVKSLQESIKIYNQSKAYYDALKSVHNIIKDARKVKLTLEMVSEITEIYTSGFNRTSRWTSWRRSRRVTPDCWRRAVRWWRNSRRS